MPVDIFQWNRVGEGGLGGNIGTFNNRKKKHTSTWEGILVPLIIAEKKTSTKDLYVCLML